MRTVWLVEENGSRASSVKCHGRHCHVELSKFLRRLDRAFLRDVTLHIILDNYGCRGPSGIIPFLYFSLAYGFSLSFFA